MAPREECELALPPGSPHALDNPVVESFCYAIKEKIRCNLRLLRQYQFFWHSAPDTCLPGVRRGSTR